MSRLNKEIRRLNTKILTLYSKVEKNVNNSVYALTNRSLEYAQKVISSDENIDHMEVDLEEDCLKLLALYQPVAGDLRYLVAVLKINNDLERISDLAVNIAERAISLIERKPVDIQFDFLLMGKKVGEMLGVTMDSLLNLDMNAAYKVCADDDVVDAMNRDMYKLVKENVARNPELIDDMLHYLGAVRSLERIADHATNIAEDILYLINGDIVRHHVGEYHAEKESNGSAQ